MTPKIRQSSGLVLVLFALHARGQVPDDLVWEPDIEYAVSGGLAAHLALDVIHPRSDKRLPAVVCIPGGDFRTADRKSCHALCIRLAQKGYVAVAVSYRLAPRYQFPAPVYDVKGAIRFLRGNAARFGIDPDRIGVIGSASGAYLALFLGLTGGVPAFEGSGPFPEQSSRVACVVNNAGPVDLTKLIGKSTLPAFLGGDLTGVPRNYTEASPIHWVTPSAAPVLTIYGANDWNIPYEQAVWLTDRMRAAGAEAELETIEGKDENSADARMFAFLAQHLALSTERELLIADHGPGKEILAVSWPSGKVLWRSPNMGGRDVRFRMDTCFTPWIPGSGSSRLMHSGKSYGPTVLHRHWKCR
jgi:acetyl esterase/lipase